MHTAGHKIISRSLRSRLAQHGGLDLKEAFLGEELAGQGHDLALHHEVALQVRPSQVEIAVFQTHLFFCLCILLDRERRSLGFGEDTKFTRDDLDLSCRDLVIHRSGTSRHFSHDRHRVLGAQRRCLLKERCVCLPFLAHYLDDAGAVAHIREHKSALVPVLLHPSHDGHFLTHICRGELAAAVSPLKPFH